MGVAAEQSVSDSRIDPLPVAGHVVIPEAQNAVAFLLDQPGSPGVPRFAMLASVDLYDHTHPMTCKVGDETSERDLAAKASFRKTFAK